DQMLQGRFMVIASGAAPAALHIPGEEHLATSEQFLELDDIPRRIVFVGGGYIAFEFAHIAAGAGAGVTILHRGKGPLELFDPDLVDRAVARTRELGINIELETPVQAVDVAGGAFQARAGDRTFPADLVVHAAGRLPDIEDLNLSAAGIEIERRG